MQNFNSAEAVWNQRIQLREVKNRLKKIAEAVNNISDSSLAQYAQMYATVLEFKPDLIIEFGRGKGNSTAVFTEAANQIKNCRVISISRENDWQEKTVKNLSKVVPKTWFDKLDSRITDIFDIDFPKLVKNNKRIIFLWDAHGWDIAEYVLGKVLPSLRPLEHLVLVHDISHFDPNSQDGSYKQGGIWRGYAGDNVKNPPYVVLNSMASPFEELIPLYDFASRNGLKIRSIQDELNNGLNQSSKKELRRLLGKEMASSTSSFHYFSLSTLPKRKNIFFPNFQKHKVSDKPYPEISFKNENKPDSSFSNLRPLVSIVTPSYNSGKFLEESIQSVLDQDYPFVEHVIQDGESSDNTLKILKKYSSSKYKDKVKWISEPDKGQSDGLNKALQRTKGEVILVLNADDVLLPYACSWGVVNLKLNPQAAVVYGDEYIINERSEIIKKFTGPAYDYKKLLCVEIVPAAQTAFIRRSYFEKVGLGSDPTLETCPDYEMWVRLGARFEMKYTPGFVCKYRWHDESEGQQSEMILKMVKAKKQVMGRVFNDRKTPPRIKSLKKRAHAGVEMWGAINNMQVRGPIPITGKLVISSFLNYPPNIIKYRGLIPGGLFSLFKYTNKKLWEKFNTSL